MKSGRIVLWLRAIFCPSRVERELGDEVRLHVDLETEKNVRAGMDPATVLRGE